MKKGKDEEKNTVPLFPRLHLNDSEKGGPRAPPRNKMALYEQLSIPSQRFKQNSNSSASASTTPPTSSEQRDALFSVQRSVSRQSSEHLDNHFSDTKVPRVQPQLEKKSDEDDFRVPVFLQTSVHDDFNNNETKLTHSNYACIQHSTVHVPSDGNDTKRRSIGVSSRTQESKSHIEENVEAVEDYSYEGRRSIVDNGSREDGIFGSLPVESTDVGDHTSETSMVDCASDLIISPDDVIGIIGQKHFWIARKAIVNQQRVFAVQVFELHRLIKVQKLMAASPDLLHNNSLLGKKSIKSSSTMKLPIDMENIVKRPPDAIKQKNGSNELNQRMECSAENNVVSKESLSSDEQNEGRQSNSKPPASVNSVMTVIPSDNGMSSWSQNQMQGHQWLIPMMSPSEGLLYKPYYPSPGLIAPFCGGCGPPGPPPMAGSFISSPYGMNIPPFSFHAGPHGFFPPPYASIADQTNHLAASGLPVQLPLKGDNNNSQYHRNSCKLSSTSRKDKLHKAIRDSDVQASRESRGRGNSSSGGSNTRLEHDVLMDRPARVIKVVPHGGVSATESAARIFQSIQQERKRHHA